MAPPPTDVLQHAAHLRTAWHPMLILLLEMLLPPDQWQVVAEYALSREPRRIDAVIVRRVDVRDWHPEYLRSLLDELQPHNLVHFKGATDDLERTDAPQLLSYAYQYMALRGLQSPAEMSLRVVAPTLRSLRTTTSRFASRPPVAPRLSSSLDSRGVPRARLRRSLRARARYRRGGSGANRDVVVRGLLTPRFLAQLEALGGVLVETAERGIHVGRVQGFVLRVVETSVAWPHPGEHLLYAVSPACLQQPGLPGALDDTERALYYRLVQGIAQLANDPRWKAIMKDAKLAKDAADKALRDLLASLPPEVRLAGLDPQVRLAGLDPQVRLAGLDPQVRLAGLAPEERLLAMPDEALRALSDSYLATLPEDIQARIRARLTR